jgi:hypothetical protein
MADSRLECPKEEFTWRLRSRLPMNIGFSFTSEQLQALRSAFGARFERRHSIDFRGRLHLPWSKYYVVLQLGRDRRVDPRRARRRAAVRTLIDSLLFGMVAIGALSLVGWLALHRSLLGL